VGGNAKFVLKNEERNGWVGWAREVFGKQKIIIKERIPKKYRIPELDNKIRKQRTRSEIKILEKASKVINVPKIIYIVNGEQDSLIPSIQEGGRGMVVGL